MWTDNQFQLSDQSSLDVSFKIWFKGYQTESCSKARELQVFDLR